MAANIGKVYQLGYVPRLGSIGETFNFEENKWTYAAAGGAVLLITLALFKRRSRKKKRALMGL